MNVIEIQTLLVAEVKYKDWKFYVESKGGAIFLQIRFEDRDNFTGSTCKQHGRKWMLSTHMTKTEIVQTALKAVFVAEEHEAREKFLYKGQAIFNTHINVDHLFQICNAENIYDLRPHV